MARLRLPAPFDYDLELVHNKETQTPTSRRQCATTTARAREDCAPPHAEQRPTDDAASWFLGALHRTHHTFAYWVQRRPAVMMLLVCVSYLFLVLVLLVRDSARL